MSAQFSRQPDSVFVSVAPPASVKQTAQARRFYRDWSTIAETIASELPAPTPKPVIEPEPEPKQTLAELLTEADTILYPERNPRVNTQPINNFCYHYGGGIVKPKPDYERGAYAVWNAIRERRNAEYLNYRRKKAEVSR